jgi:predicted outer membrane repeat protein
MWLTSWLSKRHPSELHARRRVQRFPGKRATFRPTLEALEGRIVPSTLTVTSAADSGTGSLRADIAAAHSGDTIAFAPSLAGQTIQLTSDELFIDKSLTIQGPGAGLLAISGGNAWRVFEVRGSTTNVTLSGLTITQGNAHALDTAYEGNGGGIANDNGSTLTISGCTVSGNQAQEAGGGVYNFLASLKVVNSTLSGNSTKDIYGGGDGGALYSYGGGYSVSLTGCTLSNNYAPDRGGAIYDTGGSMTISGCTLSGNGAGVSGSAIYNGGTSTTVKKGKTTTTTTNLTVSNSTFSGNYDLDWYGNRMYGYFPIDGVWTNGGGNSFQ